MASVTELLGPARRLCAERSRRATYAASIHRFLALLAVIGSVRHLANVYLAFLVGPRLPAASGARYLAASTWLLACYLCSTGATHAFRSTAPLLSHPRFRAAPVRRSTLRAVAASLALLRPMTASILGLFGVSLAATLAIWGSPGVRGLDLLCLLCAGLAAFWASYAALELWGMSSRALGYLETLAALLLVYANPDVAVKDGRLSILLLAGTVPTPATLGSQCAALAAIPAALAVGAGMTRLLRRIRTRREPAARRRSRNPLTRLYIADMPHGPFVGSYVIEGALVVWSAMPGGSLRGLSIALLALRLGWYALFLFRTEYRVSDWRPAPALAPRARLAEYARTAPLHMAICVAPLAFHAIRALGA